MANGLGEYFSDQSILANVGVPASQPSPQAGFGAGPGAPPFAQPPVTRTSVLETPPGMGETGMGIFAPNGMGAFNLGPVHPRRPPGAFRRAASRVSPFAGALGDAGDAINDAKSGAITGVAAAATVTAILVGMGLRFGAGWVVGKALAPSDAEESKYAWGGALASTFFGSIGLGVEALVAANARK
jgi:hypothetical protein